MDICAVCGGREFYVEAGYYFCKECQTQHEGKREEFADFYVDPATRLRRTRIRKDRSSSGAEQIVGWTTWEQYNFVLIGLANELIELGASTDIKMTLLQLWATYLGKLEVAFTSVNKKIVPKLARRYSKKDAEIIYGRILRRKRKKRSRSGGSGASGSSMVSSYASGGSSKAELQKQKKKLVTSEYSRYMQSQNSEVDTLSITNQSSVSGASSVSETSIVGGEKIRFNKFAKLEAKKVKVLAKTVPRLKRKQFTEKHITPSYASGPQILTPSKLWGLLYLALRINDDKIHLSDMLRFGREGHLSYYRLEHLLPPEVCLNKVEISKLNPTAEIGHKGLRHTITHLAKFLGVVQLPHSNLLTLLERYVTELQLPNGILVYAERMMATSPPSMEFNVNSTLFPNYEGRAMAFIIVVMKILFGLDGITEYEISRVIDRINISETDMAKLCMTNTTRSPCIIVCGSLLSEEDPLLMEKVSACIKSASRGYRRLLRKGTAIDAIEDALWWLECDELFNCGYGSVPNFQGEVEMDACIMNGLKMECGSAVALRDVEHPIKIARHLMENYPNQIFSNELVSKLPTLNCDNWVSSGNMLAPVSNDQEQIINMTKCSIFRPNIVDSGAGCVAWDGNIMASGTTSGGRLGKIFGGIGASGLMGCGTFATETSACALVGHGETIIKLSLARNIVEDLSVYKTCPGATLRYHLDDMLKQFDAAGGGIALQANGCFGVHFTTMLMPYAIVKDKWITFGWRIDDRRSKKYRESDIELGCPCQIAEERGELESRLFNFCEWQRYIECRRSILVKEHFPTKLRRDPHSSGTSHLYIKFIQSIQSKYEGDEPEMQYFHNLVPRDLANMMKQSIERLNENMPPPKDVVVFPPSFTSQHAYLQQLLADSDKDLPSILRKINFSTTKVGYMLKPESLEQLAAQCDIELRVVTASAHFMEKIVQTFEPPALPSIRDQRKTNDHNKLTPVIAPNLDKSSNTKRIDDPSEYLHRKYPGKIVIDPKKRRLYCKSRDSIKNRRDKDCNDFEFDQVLPDGKLRIPRSDDESEDEPLMSREVDYDLILSNFERKTMLNPIDNPWEKSRKTQYRRNGKFIKASEATDNEISNWEAENKQLKLRIRKEIMLIDDNIHDANNLKQTHDNDPIIIKEILVHEPEINDSDSDEISILTESIDSKRSSNIANDEITPKRETLILFRPFKQFWLRRCSHISHTTPHHFRLLERDFPINFRWLLHECAHIVEMSIEELYEEVCLVENYYADVLSPNNDPDMCKKYDTSQYRSVAHLKAVKKKWKV